MLLVNRRSSLKLLGGAALTVGALPALTLPAFAQQYVASKFQNFKRGTIESMNPESRTFTIVWQDLGRVKLKVSDLVVKAGSAGDQGGTTTTVSPGTQSFSCATAPSWRRSTPRGRGRRRW